MHVSERKLEGVRFGGLMRMPEQMTPSGGYHYDYGSKIDTVNLNWEWPSMPRPLAGVCPRYLGTSLSISQCGRRVALLDFQGLVHVYGLHSGVAVVDPPLMPPCMVSPSWCCVSSPVKIFYVNDCTVLVQYSDAVRLWHLDTGKQQCVFMVRGNVVLDCGYDVSHSRVAVAEYGRVVLIDLNADEGCFLLQREVRLHGAEAVCFSEDGSRLYVATNTYVLEDTLSKLKKMLVIDWDSACYRSLYDIMGWSANSNMVVFDATHLVVDGAMIEAETGVIVCHLPRSVSLFPAGRGAVVACRRVVASSSADGDSDPLLWLMSDYWPTSKRCAWVTACAL
jgi:hypothetical protein